MSEQHKAALALGRTEGRAIRRYLEALEAHKPKRGRKRTRETITKRLAAVESEIGNADPLRRLKLVQERLEDARHIRAVVDQRMPGGATSTLIAKLTPKVIGTGPALHQPLRPAAAAALCGPEEDARPSINETKLCAGSGSASRSTGPGGRLSFTKDV